MSNYIRIGCFLALAALVGCSKPSDTDQEPNSGPPRSAQEIAKSQKAIEDSVDCSRNDLGNMDLTICASIELRDAEAELDRYLKVSRESLIADIKFEKEIDPKSEANNALADFDNAQRDWKRFVQNKCRSETAYFGGSNLPRQNLRCHMTETKYRTLMLWQRWLSYRDSTPPTFPRPEFDFSYVDWEGINRAPAKAK